MLEPLGQEQKEHRLRWFTHVLTIGLIVLCNAVFLFGLWGSGINLDSLNQQEGEVFDPDKDICLRLSWQRVAGVEQPVRLCQEWINLSDTSGQTHRLKRDIEVVQGADGKLYYDRGVRVDYRLFLIVGFAVMIMVVGLLLKRFLVARYRHRLDSLGGQI